MTTQAMYDLSTDIVVSTCPAHPTVVTHMRCNRCGRLICLKCAVHTPVGYRCKACIAVQEAVYFNARSSDNVVVGLLSFVLALTISPFIGLLGELLWIGGLYLAFIAGPSAGALLAQIMRRAIKKRRGRSLAKFMTTGLITGISLIVLADTLFVGSGLISSLPLWIFATLTITTAYPQLK